MFLEHIHVVDIEISVVCEACGAELEITSDRKDKEGKWLLAVAACECCKPEKEEVE